MKLLHVTDLHLNKNWYDWVAAHALDYDATCISGDLLNLFGFDDVGNGAKSQIRWVRHWVANFPSKLFLCSGNHDYFLTEETDPFAEAEWFQAMRRKDVAVDNDTVDFKGWKFFCKPWVGGMPPQDERLILLAHAPPEGLKVSDEGFGGGGDFEVSEIVATLAPGSLVLSGHQHTPLAWHDVTIRGVHCFNPGYADPRKFHEPNRIVIDTERMRASFHGWGEHCGEVSLA